MNVFVYSGTNYAILVLFQYSVAISSKIRIVAWCGANSCLGSYYGLLCVDRVKFAANLYTGVFLISHFIWWFLETNKDNYFDLIRNLHSCNATTDRVCDII
jgi:hypothetical protein